MIDTIEILNRRAEKHWGKRLARLPGISPLLGSSSGDLDGREIWQIIPKTRFVAPALYLEIEDPKVITSLNCIYVGNEKYDGELYYFLNDGRYTVIVENRLYYFANGSRQFFEILLDYAEWIERVIDKHGEDGYVEAQFSSEELLELERTFAARLSQKMKGSYWELQLDKLQNLAKK